MEILRFEEAGSPTPRRKKSSRGLIIAGLVATLFGIGSAFASTTISINSDIPVALGQGVTAVTACDSAISVKPTTLMKVVATTPTFYLETITVTNVDTATATSGNGGVGCAGKYLNLQVFHTVTGTTSAYTCTALNFANSVTYTNAGGSPSSGSSPSVSCGSDSQTIKFQVPTGISAGNPIYSIAFPDAPSDISYFTLVSSDS
jgi:hypothetical protein